MSIIKKLVILSGKGGTGKTTLSAAFTLLAENKIVVDCDVDAADLYLLLNPEQITKSEFIGGKKAYINKDKCGQCGLCEAHCRFNAIHNFEVDTIACEGCGFCYRICPDNAITFDYSVSGHQYQSFINDTNNFLYARLLPGEGNSGKLVTELKKTASENEKENTEWLIIDGPPGIGCPVNASISQMHFALIITEPTLSGLHDLKRIIELTQKFNVPTSVVVNKYDLNDVLTEQIENFAKEKSIPVIGKIPFDMKVVEALQNGKSILEYKDSHASLEITNIWNELKTKFEV